MIIPENYSSLVRPLGRSLGRSIQDDLAPDVDYIFVYTSDDAQVYDYYDRAVQVPESFANS
jgi:hypothetical protein